MKRILMAVAIAGAASLPAFAQDAAMMACADYAAMDNAGQMAAIAELESANAEMASSQEITAEEIHQKLTTYCTGDLTLMDVYKSYFE